MEGVLSYEVQVTAVLIAFARIGTAMMFLPGFGEMRVPGRHRLALALILSVAMMFAVPVTPPSEVSLLAVLLAREALIGAYIGAAARVLFAALHSLGAVISFVSSFSNAFASGDTGYEGSTVITTLLTMTGLALIFVTDTHHLILRGLMASYDAIPAGLAPLGDLGSQMVKMASKSLYIAAMLATPFFIMGTVMNLSLGLANRVMPGMPVFFVAGPVLIALGLLLLVQSHEALLRHFLPSFAEFFGLLTP